MAYKFIYLFIMVTLGLVAYVFNLDSYEKSNANEEINTVTVEKDNLPLSKITKKRKDVLESSNDNCKHSTHTYQTINTLIKERNTAVFKFIDNLINMGISREQQERIAQNSNIPLEEFRQITSSKPLFEFTNFLPLRNDMEFVKGEIRDSYYEHLYTKNYADIIFQVEAGLLRSRHKIGKNSILLHTILNDKAIDVNIVEQLITAGLEPSFVDIIELINTEMPLNMIERLVRFTPDDINQTWNIDFQGYTLVMLAAKKQNFDLLKFLLDYGIPHSAGEYDYTAIDLITKPKNANELKQSTQIFVELATRLVTPYKINTLNEIRSWLPLNVQKTFEQYFKNSKPSLSPFEIKESSFFQQYGASLNTRVDVSNKSDALCIENNTIFLNRPLPETPTIISKINNEIPIDQFTIEENRVLVESIRNIRLSIFDAKNSGDWDDFFSNTETLVEESGSVDMYSFALLQAIQNNAPIGVIQELIDKGATLPEHAILILTVTDNLSLTKKLIPFGLNLHYRDSRNNNALFYAVRHNVSISMLRYLLYNNVQIAFEDDLLSPLLTNKYSQKIVSSFILLVSKGHIIKPSHLEAYDKLRINNMPLYNALNFIFKV